LNEWYQDENKYQVSGQKQVSGIRTKDKFQDKRLTFKGSKFQVQGSMLEPETWNLKPGT